MAPRIRFYRGTEGGRIAYAVDGAGPVLVLPAWWVSHVERDFLEPAFRDFFTRLAERATVVRYDRPGVGLSDRERSEYTLAQEVADLEALIDELGVSRIALFGMSCGGPVAVSFAARHPERTSHVVLFGAYVCGAAIATDELKAAMVGLVRAHWGLGARTMTDLFAPDMTQQEAQRHAAGQRESASTEMAAALLDLTYQMDVTDVVGEVRAPTLVLHRADDRAIPFERGRELASRVPGATFVPLEGRSHLPWLGDAAAVATAVLDFVTPATAAAAAPDEEAVFTREGDVWRIAFAGRRGHFKHSRGLADLATLLANPHTEIGAVRLMEGMPATPLARAGADAVLDDRARSDLRARLETLDETIRGAEASGHAAAALGASEERDALLRALRAATGLRGRRRSLGDAAERARKAVTARIRDSVDRIRETLPELGRHLDAAIVTGNVCSYAPDRPVRWRT